MLGTVVEGGAGVGADGAAGDPATASRVASTVWHWGDWQLPGIVTAPEPDSGCREAACTPPELLPLDDWPEVCETETDGEDRAAAIEDWFCENWV